MSRLGKVVAVLLLVVAAVALLRIPAPWSQARILHGVVVDSDVAPGGARSQGGTRGWIVVHLEDGSVVSLETSASNRPVAGAFVSVEERHGLFGQRLVARH